MKKWLNNIVMLSLVACSFGVQLNVLNDNPNTEVYIDGVLAGKGNVSGYEVLRGEHFIKVVLNKEVIYSQPLRIDSDEVKTVNTTYFVDAPLSSVPNVGSSKVEAQRVRDARGNFAVGAYVSDSTSGLNFKYYAFDRLGFQLIGWTNSSPGDINESFLFRTIYELSDYVLLSRHMNLYTGVGFGQKKVENSTTKESTNVIQGVVGVEATAATLGLPLAGVSLVLAAINKGPNDSLTAQSIMYFLAAAGGVGLSLIPNAYVDLEVGMEKSIVDKGGYKTGVLVSGAFLLFF